MQDLVGEALPQRASRRRRASGNRKDSERRVPGVNAVQASACASPNVAQGINSSEQQDTGEEQVEEQSNYECKFLLQNLLHSWMHCA